MVPRRGLEPPRCYPLVPETSASTNSATWAQARRAARAASEAAQFTDGTVPCQRIIAAENAGWKHVKKRREPRRRRDTPRRAAAPRASSPRPNAVLTVLRGADRPLRLEELKAALGPAGAAQAEELIDSLVRAATSCSTGADNTACANSSPACRSARSARTAMATVWLLPDDGSPPVFLSGQQMREVDARRPRRSARRGPGIPWPAAGRRSSKCSSDARRRSSAACTSKRASPTWCRTTRASRIACSCRRGSLGSAQSGQIVIVELTQPAGAQRAARRPGERACSAITVRPAWRRTLRSIRTACRSSFPPRCSAEAEAYGAQHPAGRDRGPRGPARRSQLVTIDGEDARDFDDAVYCERGTRRLEADRRDRRRRSLRAPRRPPLDDEARNRGTSVYFPNRVLPMLPEALSNGLCSLVPGEDRLCLCCELRVSDDGRISALALLRGRDALGGAAHVPRGRPVARAARCAAGTAAREAARAAARAARRLLVR